MTSDPETEQFQSARRKSKKTPDKLLTKGQVSDIMENVKAHKAFNPFLVQSRTGYISIRRCYINGKVI